LKDKWDLYVQSVEDMILKTSTLSAPWTLVEGNSKNYARNKVLKTIVDGLSVALKYDPFAKVPITDDKKKGKKQSRRH